MTLMKQVRWALVTVLACATMLSAGDKKDKTKAPAVQMVDSGSFAVFVRGQRVVTETFLGHLHARVPYVIGIGGSVAAGKSAKESSDICARSIRAI